MRRLFIFWTLFFLHGFGSRASAQETGFGAASPRGYYASVAHFLRNPMVKGGVIQGEDFQWRDKSLFSDSVYADLILLGEGPDGKLATGTLGATWQFRYGYVYGLVSGATALDWDEARGFGLVGGGIRKTLFNGVDCNLYGQISYGSMSLGGQERLAWEVGGYPLNHKLASASLHALFDQDEALWVEQSSRLGFVGFSWWENRELDVRRTAVNLSRRSLAIFFDTLESSAWEAETEVAAIDLPTARDRILEVRLKLFFSTVGSGPKGEARPGIHLNLSWVGENASDYQGFGVEVGFGAKQLDTHRSQELYFVIFYNYSEWFYRLPSLKWGIGLAGRI